MRAPSKTRSVFVARVPFHSGALGNPVFIREGTRMKANDPIVKANPELFEEVETPGSDVEQATAAPGEQRQ